MSEQVCRSCWYEEMTRPPLAGLRHHPRGVECKDCGSTVIDAIDVGSWPPSEGGSEEIADEDRCRYCDSDPSAEHGCDMCRTEWTINLERPVRVVRYEQATMYMYTRNEPTERMIADAYDDNEPEWYDDGNDDYSYSPENWEIVSIEEEYK